MYQSIRQSGQNMPNTIEFHRRHTHLLSNEFLREQLEPETEENPIFTDIKVILFIMKATGLFPIFKRVSYYEIRLPSGSNEYYSYFFRGLLHALTVFYLYLILGSDAMQWFYSKNDTDIGNKWIEIFLIIITYSITVIVCGLNFEIYLKIINNILNIDKEIFEKFNVIPKNNCGFSNKFLMLIGFWQISVFVWNFFEFHDFHDLTMHFLVGSFTIQNGVITMFIVFLSTLLHIIAMRFKFLNSMLERYTYKIQMTSNNARTSMETFPQNSIFIFRLHSKLLRIYRTTSESVCLIVLIYMGYAFYTVTENTYYLFVETTTQNYLSLHVLTWGISWLILHMSLLRLLCRSCGLATREANNITLLLARVYNNSKEHRNIIDKCLIKNIKQKVQFTAYGFFTIDISTLFKIFSAMTTYLVILFQFKQLEESKMEERAAEAVQA